MLIPKSSISFDPLLDPFRTTLDALVNGAASSWTGGYKCITINGMSALQYLTVRQMGWEWVPFVRGDDDYDADRIANVLKDDIVIAGIRREFFAEILDHPNAQAQIEDWIKKNVLTVMANSGTSESDAHTIVSHIIGRSFFSRTPTQKPDLAFHNLYETEAALGAISRIVDRVEQTTDAQEAAKLLKELFFYAFSDKEATLLIDEAIARGMSALIDKGISVGYIFDLLEKSTRIPVVNLLNRFIPLFLQCLTMSSHQSEPLKGLLRALSNTMQLSSNEWKAFVSAVDQYIDVIQCNKKGNEDICFLLLPRLMKMLKWPLANLQTSTQQIKTCSKNYFGMFIDTQAMASQYKESVPGLLGFGWLVAHEREDINTLFSLRPPTFRMKGDKNEAEQNDLVRFFQYILTAAALAPDPVSVLLPVCPFFGRRFAEPYVSIIKDFELVLHRLPRANLSLVKARLIPCLDVLFSTMNGKFDLARARSGLAMILLQATIDSATPALTLKAFLPILERQIPIGFKPRTSTKNIDRLLAMLSQPEKQVLVTRVLVPLLDNIIPKPPAPSTITDFEAEALLAEAIFVAQTCAWDGPEGLLSINSEKIDDIKDALDSIVTPALMSHRKLCLEFVKQNLLPCASLFSHEKIYQMSLLCCLGNMLKFDELGWNVGLLQKIKDVFFGQNTGLSPDETEHMKNIRQAIKNIPLDWFDPAIRNGVVPLIIKSW